MLVINTDCRHYRGDKPCVFGRMCEGCPTYTPWAGQVLVIKTAAMGDVLRTTSILPAIEKKYPGYKVVWAASRASAPLVRNNPLVNEILEADTGVLPALMATEFDVVISLDKTPVECGLAEIVKAKEKVGIGLGRFGTPYPINPEAEYYFSLGLSDELKFKKNKKTYHELIREACRLPDGKHKPSLHLTDGEIDKAEKIVVASGVNESAKKLGLVVGAGKTFANKAPGAAWWNDLIYKVESISGAPGGVDVILLGGPEDVPEIDAVKKIVGDIPSITTENVRVYAAVVGQMDALVCGDTLALHMATALDVPLVALFGPTCAAEIEVFGRGEKIVTLLGCSPCYKGECDITPSCVDTIDVERVAQWALSFVN